MLCRRIRDLRNGHDLNRTEVARLLFVSQHTYSDYETGKRNFPLESLCFLAHFYQTNVDYLPDLIDQKIPTPENVNKTNYLFFLELGVKFFTFHLTMR